MRQYVKIERAQKRSDLTAHMRLQSFTWIDCCFPHPKVGPIYGKLRTLRR